VRLLTALALALGVAAASGCGGDKATLPPATAAPVQEATVDWMERTAKSGPKLVFGVRKVRILDDGWSADVSIRNDSGIPWHFGQSRDAASLYFGVMLFVTGKLDEVEQRDRTRDLPGIRRAQTVTPPPPPVLGPGETWEGTIAAPGSLAAGRWLRVVFGTLYPDGDPPEGLPRQLVWITDNAHRLRS
jgi:hypothetical protein